MRSELALLRMRFGPEGCGAIAEAHVDVDEAVSPAGGIEAGWVCEDV